MDNLKLIANGRGRLSAGFQLDIRTEDRDRIKYISEEYNKITVNLHDFPDETFMADKDFDTIVRFVEDESQKDGLIQEDPASKPFSL